MIQGLVPADPLPLAFASFSLAKQRVFDAVRIVQLINAGIPPGTQHAPRLEKFRIGIEFCDHAVFNSGNQSAFIQAHIAGRKAVFDLNRPSAFFFRHQGVQYRRFAPAIETAVAAPVHFRKLRREIGFSTPRDIGYLPIFPGNV
jgi:hypothetical protein